MPDDRRQGGVNFEREYPSVVVCLTYVVCDLGVFSASLELPLLGFPKLWWWNLWLVVSGTWVVPVEVGGRCSGVFACFLVGVCAVRK